MPAPDMKLNDFDVLAFDVYGTLVDWDTGLSNALQPLLAKYPQIQSQSDGHKWTTEDALHAFESVERDIQVREPGLPYPVLLARSHAVLEERIRALLGLENKSATVDVPVSDPRVGESSAQGAEADGKEKDMHTKFGNSIPQWPLFPDTHDALQRLSKHFKLCVLSNVDRYSFGYTHLKLSENPPSSSSPSPEELAKYTAPSDEDRAKGALWLPQERQATKSPFTLLLTAQDVGSYKPAVKGFKRTLEIVDTHPSLLGSSSSSSSVPPPPSVDTRKKVEDRVLWVSCSLYADITTTHQLGIRSAFIDRGGFARGSVEEEGGNDNKKYTWKFNTVGELADAVEKEVLGI